MDPALKKRLIGASVLVLLAVIFLPMLFDGGRPTAGDTTQMDIPVPPQRDFETRVVPLDLPAPTSGIADAIGVAPTAETASSGSVVTDVPALIDEPVAGVDALAPARVDAVSGETVAGGERPATARDAVVPPAAPIPSTAAEERAEPSVAPTAATVSTATPTGAGRFMVNIGSYANAGNAAQLEASLRAAGLVVRSETVIVDDKAARRLRLGPYATRALAENARIMAKSVRADIPASVIEIDDSPASDAPARNPARSGVSAFAVQVAVLSDVAKANALRDALRAAGFAAFVEKLEPEKAVVYRVRVGPEADRANAEKIRSAVKQRFGHDAIIVDYP